LNLKITSFNLLYNFRPSANENQIAQIFYVNEVKNEDSSHHDKNHFSAGEKDQRNAKVGENKKYIGQNMARATNLSPIRRKI